MTIVDSYYFLLTDMHNTFPDTTCTDEIDKVVQVLGVSKNLTCLETAEKYPYMCSLPEIGADGGKCCQACKDVGRCKTITFRILVSWC